MTLYNKNISEIEENGKRITLLSLTLPLILESVLLQFYSTANTLLLQGYAESAVTAAAVSESVINIAIVIFSMVIKGTVILTSFSLGKNDRGEAARITGTAFITVTVLSILVGAGMCVLSPWLISLMNLEGPVAAEATNYLRIRSAFIVFTALMSFFNNMLIANGHTKSTMLIGITSNALNIVLCYAFLYTEITLPFSGICAVAVSSVISQFLGALASFLYFLKAKCPYQPSFRRKTFARIMKLGIPGGMCSLSYTLSQTVTTSFTVLLGDAIVNAKVYIGNIVIYTSRISLALGSATGILMGRHRGAGRLDSTVKLFRQNVFIAILCNLTLSLTVFLLCKPLISLFTSREEIIAIATPIMLIDVLIEASRAVNHITESSLNANGDVKTTLTVSTFSTWFFGVLAAYVFGIVLNWGLVGIWFAFLADETFKAIIYCLRWKSKKWQALKL